MAKQSCDELLIDDWFIKALCCTRTWHFSTLNLQRTDTNAFMSSKLVYKLKWGGGCFCFEEKLMSRYWQSCPERADVCMKRKWALLCMFGFAWGNIPETLKNVWRTQPLYISNTEKEQTVPRMPGENTVQIVWGRREQIREKAVCSSGLQGNSSLESQVRELKEK